MDKRIQDRRRFIKALYKDVEGDVEIRVLPSGAQIFTRNLNEIDAFCEKHQGQNIHFGVATRKERATQGGKKDCLYLPGLWVDIDFKNGISEGEADRIIRDGPIKPSVIVYSGNGVHLYFLFKEAEEASTEFEPIMEKMARYYRGDTGVKDISRTLRLPGTFNQKYSPPRQVFLVDLNEIRYDPCDFEVFENIKEPTGNINDEWKEDILEGVSEGTRNESAAKLAGRYFNIGLTRREVLDNLITWNGRNNPPLPDEELERVVKSIEKTHFRNHPQVIDSFPYVDVSDIDQALHDLKHIRRDGLKSGFEGIDDKVGGVWRDGIVISGKPGDGKSVFSLNLAVGFVKGGHRVILLDLENDRRDVIKRLALIALNRELGQRSPTELRLLEEGLKDKHKEILTRVLGTNLTLFSVGDQNITTKALDTWLKLASEEIGRTKDPERNRGKQAFVIIDSINELSSAYPLAKGLYESLERWLAEIKRLRVKYQIPICLICHVPKDSPVEIFSPKGSSGIAHFARTQIIIKKAHEGDVNSSIEAHVVRSQFGNTTGKKPKEFIFDRAKLGLVEVKAKYQDTEVSE